MTPSLNKYFKYKEFHGVVHKSCNLKTMDYRYVWCFLCGAKLVEVAPGMLKCAWAASLGDKWNDIMQSLLDELPVSIIEVQSEFLTMGGENALYSEQEVPISKESKIMEAV